MKSKEKEILVYCEQSGESYYKLNFSNRYGLKFAHSHQELCERLSSSRFSDLLIIDSNKQECDLLRKIKPAIEQIPSVLVMDNDDLEMIHLGLELGMNDVFIKPAPINLFLAKIKRYIYPEFNNYKETNLDKRFEELGLTIKEIKILRSLLSASDKRRHRSSLVEAIWGNVSVHQKTLDVHIYNLRKKIEGTEFSIISEGQGEFSVKLGVQSKLEASV